MGRFLVITPEDRVIGDHDKLYQARVDRSQRPARQGRNMNRIIDTRTGKILVKPGDPAGASQAAHHKSSSFWKNFTLKV